MTVHYEIRVSGHLGPALRSVLAGTRAEKVPGHTLIAGNLSREEFRVLLLRMEQADVQLVRLDWTVGPSSP